MHSGGCPERGERGRKAGSARLRSRGTAWLFKNKQGINWEQGWTVGGAANVLRVFRIVVGTKGRSFRQRKKVDMITNSTDATLQHAFLVLNMYDGKVEESWDWET